MRKKITIVLFLCLFGLPTFVFSATGNILLEYWLSTKTQETGESDSKSKIDAAILLGYALGIKDSFQGKEFNIPEGVNIQQLVRILGKYLEDNPEK